MKYLRNLSSLPATTLNRLLLGELDAKAIVKSKEDLELVQKLGIPIDIERSIREGGEDVLDILLDELDPEEVVGAAIEVLGKNFYTVSTHLAAKIYRKVDHRKYADALVLMHNMPEALLHYLVVKWPDLGRLVTSNPAIPETPEISDAYIAGLFSRETVIYKRILHPRLSYEQLYRKYSKRITPLIRIALLGRKEYGVTAYFVNPPYRRTIGRILRVLQGAETVDVRAEWQFHVLECLSEGVKRTKEIRASRFTAVNVQWCYFYGWIRRVGRGLWEITDVGREALQILRKCPLTPINLPISPTREGVKCMLTRRW